jgi:hypothetical protein
LIRIGRFIWHAACGRAGVTANEDIAMIQPPAAYPLVTMSLLDRAIFASISAMSVFVLFSPLF